MEDWNRAKDEVEFKPIAPLEPPGDTAFLGDHSRPPKAHPRFSISRAQLNPGAPITPPPGCAPDPHRNKPFTGVR